MATNTLQKKKVNYKHGLYAYSDETFTNPIVIPFNKSVSIVEENIAKMQKNNRSYVMSKIKYNRKNYYVAGEYLS